MFNGFASVEGRLDQGDAKITGIDRHLGARRQIGDGHLRPQLHSLAASFVANKLLQTLGPAGDLADHPGLDHIAKDLQVGLVVAVRLPRSGMDKGRWHRTADA